MAVAADCLRAYRWQELDDEGEPTAEARVGALLEAEHYALIRAFLTAPGGRKGR